ncbi:MAG TPA: DUF1223 domain-containing protein [Blastocatellia bacterium]|nr:DUF1223 domain-containing protein [Blastocatellia bacterium]
MKTKMIYILLIVAAAVLCTVILARRASTPAPVNTGAPEAETAVLPIDGNAAPVLVELFTSEGCSSCPPADDVLARLDEQSNSGAPIIAIGEHVDYWNRLGWTDPYSSAEFSARQNDYARAFARDDIYTPQMIVDGRVEFVGSNFARAREEIIRATRNPKASVTISIAEGATARTDTIPLAVRVENLPEISEGDTADVMLAITESRLMSSVSRGENAGRKLTHAAAARRLTTIGSVDLQRGAFSAAPVARIEPDWKRENLKTVVFVQERASRRVLGAAAVSLNHQ